MALHGNLVAGDIHIVYNWSFADQQAREAQSVEEGDIGKLAYQVDDSSIWLLTAVQPVSVWQQIDVGGTPAIHGASHVGAGDPVPSASQATPGLMSAADKTKLDALPDEYAINGSSGEDSTQQTSFQLKYRMTMPAGTSGGDYRIGVSLAWSADNTAAMFKARLLVDGQDTEWEFMDKPPDTYAQGFYGSASGFIKKNLGSGAHTLDIEYCVDSGSYTAYIKRAYIEVGKVGAAA